MQNRRKKYWEVKQFFTEVVMTHMDRVEDLNNPLFRAECGLPDTVQPVSEVKFELTATDANGSAVIAQLTVVVD